MRDICTESVVPIVPRVHHRILKYALLAGAGLALVMLVFGELFALIPLAVFWILLRKILRFTDGEYEYVHTNDVFDVDVVTRNSKRKNVVTVNLSQVELVAPQDSHELGGYDRLPEKDLSGDPEAANRYVMVCSINGKKSRLFLRLDPKMHSSLKQWIPGKVRA